MARPDVSGGAPAAPAEPARGEPDGIDVQAELPHASLFEAKQLEQSWLQPLDDPIWTDDYDHVRGDDPILGIYLNRRAWALPWWIMKKPHVANVALDAEPVLVTLCPMCSTASAFRAEVEGRHPLLFRVRGRYNGTMLLEDRSTGSLWSPITGEALAGPLRRANLARLPLSQCLWSQWLEMHPKTLVLYADPASRQSRGNASPGSPGIKPEFRASLVRPLDERLPHNALVLGVIAGAKARAYPLETLERTGPVVNDLLGGVEMVVRCRPGTLQALAFQRRVGERVLVFRHSEERGVHDEETRSAWNEMGEAVSGPLTGTQLAYVDSGVGEWYAFAACRPEAEIFELD